MKKKENFFLELIKTVILAALIIIPIRAFIFQPFLVRGSSMEPNFHLGDYLIVDQLTYRFREPQRDEVIVHYAPHEPSRRYIKRIIGLPGETIVIDEGEIKIFKEGDEILINSNFISLETPGSIDKELGENQYFVLGDNRKASLDSRNWGSLEREDIIGRVLFKVSPKSILAEI